MAKTKISEYSATAANNTDVESVNIAEGCAPSGINNAIREVMSHLKDFQTGSAGDSLTVGGNFSVTGTVTIPDNAISGDKVEGGTINAVTINTLSAGQANFADNAKAIFGADSDLQIWHNSTGGYSIIRDAGFGDLYIEGSSNIRLRDPDGRQAATFTPTGSQTFYHNNSVKLATTATGIDVTGTVVADGLTVAPDANRDVQVSSFGTYSMRLENTSVNAGGLIDLKSNGGISITSGSKSILKADGATGDISFYEDTGTTAKMVWDASAESLGIGTNNPAVFDQVGSDDLVVGSGTAGHGITVYSATNGSGSVAFADGTTTTDQYRGRLQYAHTDDSMRFFTSATERLRITSAGSVGIGTSSPTNVKLQLNNSGTDTVGTGNLGFGGGSTPLWVWRLGASDADLNLDRFSGSWQSTPALTVLRSSGNVGIGVSLPEAKLDVYGDIKIGTTANSNFLNRSDAHWIQYNGGATTNNTYIRVASTTAAGIGKTISMYTDAVERLRLDASGNLGLGVTPSAGGATADYKLFEVGSAGGASLYAGNGQSLFCTNVAWSGGTANYKVSSRAPLMYSQESGTHVWKIAPSGTAGNAISFNQAMTLDASGRLGIGTSSPAGKIDVQTGTNEYSVFRSTVAGADILLKDSGTTLGNVRLRGISNAMAFIAGGDERMRIDSAGNVGIGQTSITRAFTNYNQLNINGSSGATIQMQFGGNLASNIVADNNALYLQNISAISFNVGGTGTGTERARIDSSGALLVGTTTAGTKSGDGVIGFGTHGGIITNNINSVATSGTLDIAINTTGGGYQGFLIVANVLNANAAIRTQSTFSVFGRGTDSSIQQIATDNGASGGASFTVTTPSNGVIRITNTYAGTTKVTVHFFGGNSG